MLGVISLLNTKTMGASTLLDTSDPDKFITFSGRIGFNTSNRTFPSGYYNVWNHDSWGTGFDIGALVNLNFKEYLSIQPGIFFETRSGYFTYLTEYLDFYSNKQDYYEMGSRSSCNITIPVVGVVKLNLVENVKVLAELGPYFQFNLADKGQNNLTVLYRMPQSNVYDHYTAKHNSIDVGIKIGGGLQFFDHYYLGVHYLAGACNAWKRPEGGRNKGWMFTIGYDL